jgi:small-conductance mechanosensitive channel
VIPENLFLESLSVNSQVIIQLARFLITLGIGILATRLVLMPFTHRILVRNRDEKTLHSMVNFVGIIGLFLSLTLALQAGSFGNLTTIIGAIAAALTVAIGFGMREQVGNMVSGLFIYFDNPFI